MKQITIQSFNGIGDLLFLTPTLRRIKERYPDSAITVNTNHPVLLFGNPFVDLVSGRKQGVFLGYPDPIHAKEPTCHHIVSDWKIVKEAYSLDLQEPELKPELFLGPWEPEPLFPPVTIGVQIRHKGHWHAKKVWPYFRQLCQPPFYEIPLFQDLVSLVRFISRCSAVVCAEGGISHIARAVGTPAVVIYGGFASPSWNGYGDHINISKIMDCSYCYNPSPCKAPVERQCMREISIQTVRKAALSLVGEEHGA
jgi:ADP-heptose:LPS heptosyltransferase